MKSIGYITLAEAEKISGIKADTLKKRCQEGRLEGAIKQGKTWYVPRSEVIKTDKPASRDSVLAILAMLAESGVEIGVTLFLSGVLVTGVLVSKKRYFSEVKHSLQQAVEDKRAPEQILDLYKNIFGNIEGEKKDVKEILDEPVHYLHLLKVKVKDNRELIDVGQHGMRLKISSVDGFIWGNMV